MYSPIIACFVAHFITHSPIGELKVQLHCHFLFLSTSSFFERIKKKNRRGKTSNLISTLAGAHLSTVRTADRRLCILTQVWLLSLWTLATSDIVPLSYQQPVRQKTAQPFLSKAQQLSIWRDRTTPPNLTSGLTSCTPTSV